MEGCTGKEVKQRCFEDIFELSGRFSVSWLCAVYGVSSSGYYRWLKAGDAPNRYQRLHQEIDRVVLDIHSAHPSYGYRIVRAFILQETGWILSNQAILKSMHRLHVRSEVRKKKNHLIGREHAKFANILNRQFHPNAPLRHIAADICQFRNKGTKYFLAAYLDMFNNEILSWSVGTQDDVSLVLSALKGVLALKYPDQPMLIHSDQGSQYASLSYVKLLQGNGILQSMSRAGTPRDNAVMESCFGWLKDVLYKDFDISHVSDVRFTVQRAVLHFNSARPAYALNYKTPVRFKAEQGF